MPNLRYHSVATVCKLSPGLPPTSTGGSRRSFFVGINRTKTRCTAKPTELAQVWSSFSSRSRANTLLNEIRTSHPKRSTQPSSTVQSRCESVPSNWKSRSKAGSIHPIFICFCAPTGEFKISIAQQLGLPGDPSLLHWRDHPLRASETTAVWRRRNYATSHRSCSREHFQSWSRL